MSTSPSLGPLTHVSTLPEWHSGAKPQITFYIGPTNPRGRCPAVSQVTLTPVILFKTTFKDLQTTVSRFFNKDLPVVIVGRTCIVTDDDSFVPCLNGCRFLHREIAGDHVLVRIYRDDKTISKARKALDDYARQVADETITTFSEESGST
ncbi:unnamed protein product [Caenorhabditis brenneri]